MVDGRPGVMVDGKLVVWHLRWRNGRQGYLGSIMVVVILDYGRTGYRFTEMAGFSCYGRWSNLDRVMVVMSVGIMVGVLELCGKDRGRIPNNLNTVWIDGGRFRWNVRWRGLVI